MRASDPFDVFQAATEAPDRAALLHARGAVSYRKLAEQCSLAVSWLERNLGPRTTWPGKNQPLAVLAETCVEQIAMTYASMALGLSVLPVHPRYTRSEREELLHQAQASLLVTRDWQETPLSPTRPAAGCQGSEQILALVATSGTNHSPRLARLSRRAFRASAAGSARRLGWQPHDRWALAIPFAHIGGLSILTRCLAARRSIVLVEPSERPSSERLIDALFEHGVSMLSLVPAQLTRLLEVKGWTAPPQLRLTLVGGAAASPALLQRAWQRGLAPLPSYGLTEACSQVCTVGPESAESRDPGRAGAGPPLPGVEVRVEHGVIQVRGNNLFSGYCGAAFQRPDAWFETGDLGYLDQGGCLHVTGRESLLIISGGENVHPEQVEAVLQRLTGTRRICVFGIADATWGQRVALAIEGPRDQQLVSRLSEHAQQHLASFRRPRGVVFLDKFPELASGKIARLAIAEACAQCLERLDYPS